MTRVLEFSGPRAPKRFQLLWASLMAGGDGKGERTPGTIRKEARLQDALEPLSDQSSTNGGGPTLKADGAMITVSQEDFELLVQYSEKTQWSPQVSKDVVDLWDWLSTAEKRD
jgi:hypothetical protein